MKSLKLTKEEAKAQYDCCPSTDGSEDGPRYPWGTSLCLGTEALEKLGLGLLPVGTEVLVTARAVITGNSSRQRQSGEKTEDMDIQLTAMDVELVQDRDMRAAAKLYG
jgi:hypothetical protein